ncbi:MAG: hypothetical protein LC667_19615 [Thioalkalivibrio sp.]|nr:hypothetical protein [Thioalkalivibrio sp.]
MTVAAMAYGARELHIASDGSWSLIEPDVSTAVRPDAVDPDAYELFAADGEPGWSGDIYFLDSTQLRHACEIEVGKAISKHIFRRFLKRDYEDRKTGESMQARYRFPVHDPVIKEIIQRVREGALDEMVEMNLSELYEGRGGA